MTARVHILASRPRGAIDICATANLRARVDQRRAGAGRAPARTCGVRALVHGEAHEALDEPLARAKTLNRWRRAWKGALIAEANPEWRDLRAEMPL